MRAWLGLGLISLAGCSSGTFVSLTLEQAVATPPTAHIALTAVLAGHTATAQLPRSNDGVLHFPTTATLQIDSGSGGMVVSAQALDAAGNVIDIADGTVDVVSGKTLPLTLYLGGPVGDLSSTPPDLVGDDDLGDGGSATGAPSAPTNVVASSGNAQATVSWSAPASVGGGAIVSYVVTSSPGAMQLTTSDSTTTATFTGLANGTTYTFSVAATNSVGTGPSATSNPVTPTGTPMAPSAPTNVSAVANVDHGATISWTGSDDHGSALQGYTLAATQLSGSLGTATPTMTSLAVTGLTPGSQYTFTVTATNAVGMSNASLPSNAITAATKPAAPAGVQAVTNVANGATVSWTAPSSDGFSAITKYTVRASPGSVSAQAAGSATSVPITGLTPGTSYTFTVVATNAIGDGPASSASAGVVGCGGSTTESCFNGRDDDCNGLVDCADSGCNPAAHCVPSLPGATYGTLYGSASSTCPANLTAADVYSNFPSGSGAGECFCQYPSTGTCTATYYSNTDTNPADTCSSPVTQTNNPVTFTSTCTNVPMNIAESVANIGGCTCSPPSGTATPPTFANLGVATNEFCGAASVGGGCSAGNVCVPVVDAGDSVCAMVDAGTSCGSYYSSSADWFTGYSDTRSCEACSSQPAPVPYAVFFIYNGPDCSGGGSGYSTAGSQCAPSQVKQATGSIQYDSGNKSVECKAYPPSTGSLTGTGAVHVCCK